ncbi:class I SAM-dependent methyltransferase [Sphaerisporangium album]|uniref:Class I SAM-dependent methyltransferase n=1 Tax=Sphaerisporangium album TaxID=509200 RepID=A0A367EI01_9ACTN|nr:class I SAM-dependent methyltransferase [Sphaerisporangium album]RCG17399.1 class I SAM-dependent methyltransferase [Sphaerisporangium album]
MAAREALTPKALDRIPGWFWGTDQRLFSWILSEKAVGEPPGNLLELGTYLGKSAILIGSHLRAGETLTVCDLFESDAPEEANNAETSRSYSSLTRDKFEQNYLTFHEKLPKIVHGPTSVILDHVAPNSCRFVHVDASHLYVHVKDDVLASRRVLRPDGVVVFDDYRSVHTPGVAMAVWEAVANLGLEPVAISPQKLYATWGDPGPLRERMRMWLEKTPDLWFTVDPLGDRDLLRVNEVKKPADPPVDAATLRKLTAELKRTSAELKQAVAESKSATASLRKATSEISLAGPVAQRAVRWTRRRLRAAKTTTKD